MYLFANLGAVDFYDRCGFSKINEYGYSVKEELCSSGSEGERFLPVNPADVQMKQKYMDMENVSYAKDIDCFIVTEQEGDTLFLQSIVCANQVTLSG